MTISVGALTLDCSEVSVVADFWSAALGVPVDSGASPYMASINRESPALPRFLFLQVPESKAAKNRLHLNLVVDGDGSRGDEVARLERILRRIREVDRSNIRSTIAGFSA